MSNKNSTPIYVKNLNKGMGMNEAMVNPTPYRSSRELTILNNLSESVEMTPDAVTVTCPDCGMAIEGDMCPVCGLVESDDGGVVDLEAEIKKELEEEMDPAGDDYVEQEPTINEADLEGGDGSGEQAEEVDDTLASIPGNIDPADGEVQKKLDDVLKEYCVALGHKNFKKARKLLESNKVKAVGNKNVIMLEKVVGKKTIRSQKVRTSILSESVQSRKPGAKKPTRSAAVIKATRRAKARRGMYESIRKTRLQKGIIRLLESKGIVLSNPNQLKKIINEAYRINEEVELPEDKALSTIEQVLGDYGIEVTDSSVDNVDGVIVAEVTVRDVDAEVYLDDVAEEINGQLGDDVADVTYEEPTTESDGEGFGGEEVTIEFIIVPKATFDESTEMDNIEFDPAVDPKSKFDNQETPKSVSDAEQDATDRALEEDDEDSGSLEDEIQKELSGDDAGDEGDLEESIRNRMFESVAGGRNNVRCKLNPAFIQKGQFILDAEEGAVFQALTEAVHTKQGYDLTIDMLNSKNPYHSDLSKGAEITLTKNGSYFLLRENPLL